MGENSTPIDLAGPADAASNHQKRISVIMPAYNEAGTVARTLDELMSLPLQLDVIVVDDGSEDGTGDIATGVPGVRVLRHPTNRGNGAALRTGIRAAQGEIIVFMDADGQHDPLELPNLLEKMDGYDLVVGARALQSGVWYRNLANWLYCTFASYVVGFRVQDLTSGFRVFRASLVKSMCYLLPNRFSSEVTTTLAVARAGYGVGYVPIHVRPRQAGKSKIHVFRDGMRFLIIMTKITTLFSPLKVLGPIGLAVAMPGLVIAIYRLIAGGLWTIPVTISLTIGALIMVLGLVSEQIATLRLQHME